MKKHILIFTSLAFCLMAAPCGLRAEDGDKTGKRDINQFLDNHPKLKEKILAKFDANHNGKLDGDEIEAFKKWRKEHREEFQAWREKHGKKDGASGTDSSSSTGTTPTPTPAQ
jgi:hypothetical protein